MNAQKTRLRRTLGLALATSVAGVGFAAPMAHAAVGDPGLMLTTNVTEVTDVDENGTVNAGDQITFSLSAWNEGTTAITDGAFSDNLMSGETCYVWDADSESYVEGENGALSISNRNAAGDPSQDTYCTYTYTITSDDTTAGVVINNASLLSEETGESAGPVSLNYRLGYTAPVANADASETLNTDQIVVNVLDNDTADALNGLVPGSVDLIDVDGNATDTLTVDGQGTFTVDEEGRVTFVPDAEFVGDAVVDYRVADTAGQYTTSTLTISVTAPVIAPVATDDTGSAVAGPVTIDVLANDVAGDTPIVAETLQLIDANGGGTPEIAIEGQGTYAVVEGMIVFTPVEGWTGTADAVTYQILDEDGDSAQATVTATVEAAVVDVVTVAADDAVETAFDTTVTVDVLANDTLAEGATWNLDSFTLLDADGNAVESVEVEGGLFAIVDGQIVFTPTAGYVGNATVAYAIDDSEGATASASLTVAVAAEVVAVAPTANDDRIMLDYGMTSLAGDVLFNDEAGDSPIDPATLTLVNADGEDVSTLTVDGHTFEVVDGRVLFTAAEGWDFSPVSVQYRVADEDGDFSDVATASFDGSPGVIIDDSVAVDDAAETAFETAVEIDVLANDTTPEGVTLDESTLTLIDADGNAVESLAVEGGVYTVVTDDDDDAHIVFTPAEDFSGVAGAATYAVTDSAGRTITAEVQVTVNDEVIAPNSDAVDDKVDTAYNKPITIDVLANDVAGENLTFDVDSLTLVNADGEAVENLKVDGGTFAVVDGKVVFTPDEDFSGTVGPVTYRVTDSSGKDVEATVTVVVGEPEDEQKPEAPKDDDEKKPDIVTGGDATRGNTGGALAAFAALFAGAGLALRRKFGLVSE